MTRNMSLCPDALLLMLRAALLGTSFFVFVQGKGLTVISGKGRGQVCADCEPDPFDPKELKWALVTLGLVTTLFLAVCTCRCYPKLKEVCTTDPVERARIRNQFHCESAMAARRGSGAPPQQQQQQQRNMSASNTSSAARIRQPAINSKAHPEVVQISGIASPGRVIQRRAADRRRKSYPRSIRCSSIPPSPNLFAVPEANIAPCPGRTISNANAHGSERLANALLSPHNIVRHAKRRQFAFSPPSHQEQYEQQKRGEERDHHLSQDQADAGTPVHRTRQRKGSESVVSCIPTPASPSSINRTCEQHTSSSSRNRSCVRPECQSPISGRRSSTLATIDPGCLHTHANAHHHCTSTQQQELSSPRFLDLAHQSPGSRRGSASSSGRHASQPSGRELAAKVRFDQVS